MNNKVYFYRVGIDTHSHKDSNNNDHYMGPYAYFNFNVWIQRGQLYPYSDDELNRFYKFASREKASEYIKFNIDNYKLKCVPTLSNAWRPGPFEDIDLRQKMIDRMGGMSKSGKFHIYGFDSIMQALKWYNDPEELEFLESLGFGMFKFLVKTQNLIVGKNQSVYFPDKNDIFEKDKIQLSTLHKSVNIPVAFHPETSVNCFSKNS